jgi:hypothetical protein
MVKEVNVILSNGQMVKLVKVMKVKWSKSLRWSRWSRFDEQDGQGYILKEVKFRWSRSRW